MVCRNWAYVRELLSHQLNYNLLRTKTFLFADWLVKSKSNSSWCMQTMHCSILIIWFFSPTIHTNWKHLGSNFLLCRWWQKVYLLDLLEHYPFSWKNTRAAVRMLVQVPVQPSRTNQVLPTYCILLTCTYCLHKNTFSEFLHLQELKCLLSFPFFWWAAVEELARTSPSSSKNAKRQAWKYSIWALLCTSSTPSSSENPVDHH